MRTSTFCSRLLVALLLLGLLVGCALSGAPAPTPAAVATPGDAQRTLASLRQLSDYPLYELHYEGDYDFGRYLKTGLPRPTATRPGGGFGCSTFAALADDDQRVVGRNFDWALHPALILFTDPPDGYAAVAMVDLHYLGFDAGHTPLDDPIDLLRAPYLPFDGMNARGLAVGMMAVPHAEGGSDPQKPTLDELELIRLMLDYAASVPEALKLIRGYNVDFGSVPVHYLVADAAGDAAVIEYLDGQPVIVPAGGGWQVATNFILSEEQPEGSRSSCERYNRLYARLVEVGGAVSPEAGMGLLRGVAQGGENATRWSVVYDLSARRVRLAMGQDYERIFEFALAGD